MAFVLVLGAGAGAAQADSTAVTACGQELGEPGDYHLAQDLGPCAGHGVVISASGVRFSLNGHTITGVSSQASCDIDNPQTGVLIPGSVADVKVGGGTVRGFVDGVNLSGTSSRLTAMKLLDNCINGVVVSGNGGQVDTSVVSGSNDGILLCEAQDALLTANELVGNARYGVVLSCGNGTGQNRVVRNIMRENGLPGGDGGGLAIFNSGSDLVEGNALSGNWSGIWLSYTSQAVVRDNTMNGNLTYGLSLSTDAQSNTLELNTACGNAGGDVSDANGFAMNTWLGNVFGPGGC